MTNEAKTMAQLAYIGVDHVPSEGTWLLEKGERVVTRPEVFGIDPGCEGGDQTAAASFVVKDGKTFIRNALVVDLYARRYRKSRLWRAWLQLMRSGKGYRQWISSEAAGARDRLGANPKPSRVKHSAKLDRYQRRAHDGER
jgi:hypothetical protein